ncbi:MAG: HAMP domain-containing histidine kinase [Methanobacteriota archaeon]|nr:MAG: HAMP domain-containing histidine kinase [Euryarchaeota archaeon]
MLKTIPGAAALNRGERNGSEDEGLPAYMDLLSHDILNLNQTVLSYIELMVSSPDLDPRSGEHAKKAASQIRISTQIVEGINALCLLQKERNVVTTTANLKEEVDGVERALQSLLPYRGVHCTVDTEDEAPVVNVKNLVSQSILNAVMNMAQLDPSEEPKIDIHVKRCEGGGNNDWVVRIHDANAEFPPGVELDSVVDERGESRSRIVKLAGVLLSKLMVERLGGKIKVDRDGEHAGAISLTFKGAQTK